MLSNRDKMIERLVPRFGLKQAVYMQAAMDAGAKMHKGGFVYVHTWDGKGIIANPRIEKDGTIRRRQ